MYYNIKTLIINRRLFRISLTQLKTGRRGPLKDLEGHLGVADYQTAQLSDFLFVAGTLSVERSRFGDKIFSYLLRSTFHLLLGISGLFIKVVKFTSSQP